jgi:hypothetical protein
MKAVLDALLATEDQPVNYGLTEGDVAAIAACYDWESRVDESNWSADTEYETLAEMVAAEPAGFLADISSYYGDDYYLGREGERRVNWLCQCGNGGLMVPESEVPASCPVCGHDIGPDRGDDLDPDDLYDFDESMDGDHESALESVYGPNDW